MGHGRDGVQSRDEDAAGVVAAAVSVDGNFADVVDGSAATGEAGVECESNAGGAAAGFGLHLAGKAAAITSASASRNPGCGLHARVQDTERHVLLLLFDH